MCSAGNRRASRLCGASTPAAQARDFNNVSASALQRTILVLDRRASASLSVAGFTHEKHQSGNNENDDDDAGPETGFEDASDNRACGSYNGE